MSEDTKEKVENVGAGIEDTQTSRVFGKEKEKLFSVLEDSDISITEKNVKIEKYFQNLLEFQEFEELKTLVIDSSYRISWGELIQDGVVNIENRKVEGIYWKGNLDLQGTSIRSLGKLKKIEGVINCKDLETLTDLGKLEEVGGYVDIRGTKIKSLGKLKETGKFLDCENVENLEDLGELEEVGGGLILRGTSIKSLGKLKRVNGWLSCKNLKKLEDLGKIEDILGVLDIRGIKIKLQLEVIKKYKENKLKVGKEIYFGGNLEIIEKLLEQENKINLDGVSREDNLARIPGILDVKDIDIKKQLEFIYKREIGKLKIMNITIDKNLKEIRERIYNEGKINYAKYREVFGEDVNEIKDEEMKKIGEEILIREYDKVKVKIEEQGNRIIEKRKGKTLTEEEKKELRECILKLDRELKRKREKIESFGINLSNVLGNLVFFDKNLKNYIIVFNCKLYFIFIK